ncbi:MAG: helix-turn-helix domain-containing protein [Flavobacteriales bacterium]
MATGEHPTLSAVQLAEHFLLYTKRHVFLTGKAGTGKTTFLRHIINTIHKKTLVTAPTGIAALNAGGVTLHSQFQLPFAGFLPVQGDFMVNDQVKFETFSTLSRHLHMNNMKRRAIREAELLIIDEVSMLRSDLLDAIDFVLRFVRRTREPFGGIQVLFIGDMMQLPPVVKRQEWEVLRNYYSSPFFFDAHVLRQDTPVYIELTKIYRQTDREFTDILNNLRYNRLTEADIEQLNTHYHPGFEPAKDEGYIRLTTHNRDADEINRRELEALTGPGQLYRAVVAGEFPPHIYPCDEDMLLKPGAQVMFIKNDPTGMQRFYNGKIAWVRSATEEELWVEFEDGETMPVDLYQWQNIRYTVDEGTKVIKEDVIGTYDQFPLRLAWAITIHKSQGLTFEKAIIDIEKVFASGQAYVALSRLRSLGGLVLSARITARGIDYDPSLRQFEERKTQQGELQQLLQTASAEYTESFCLKAFNLMPLLRDWKEHLDTYGEKDSVAEKQKNLAWARSILEKISALRELADKFCVQLHKGFIGGDMQYVQQRLEAAIAYFDKPLKEICSEIYLRKKAMARIYRAKAYSTELEEADAACMQVIASLHKAGVMMFAMLNGSEAAEERWKNTPDLSWRIALMQQDSSAEEDRVYTNAGNKKEKKKKTPKEKKPKAEKGSTFRLTLQMLLDGKTPEEISVGRGLALSTVETHIVRLIKEEQLPIEKVVSSDEVQEMIRFLDKHEDTKLWDLRHALPTEEDFRRLKFVHAYRETLK